MTTPADTALAPATTAVQLATEEAASRRDAEHPRARHHMYPGFIWVSAAFSRAPGLTRTTGSISLDRALRETPGWPARLARPGLDVRA